MEKVKKEHKMENIEGIEVGTESKKLNELQGKDKKEILKQIKQEKEQEKLKTKGKVIEQERIEERSLRGNQGKRR